MHFSQVGGFNALRPLFDKLAAEYEVVVTGRWAVCRKLMERGIQCKTYTELGIVGTFTITAPTTDWLAGIAPFLIITDTINLSRVSDGTDCRYIWASARACSIPTIAYVDCWWGYSERFLLPGETVAPVLPNRIAVIDAHVREELIKRDFSAEKIIVLGSPHFGRLVELPKKNNQYENQRIRAKYSIGQDAPLLLFVSQPVEKTFGSDAVWGYTEKTTLRDLLETLLRFPASLTTNLVLLILLHPEEEEEELKQISVGENSGIDIRFIRENEPYKLIMASDLVLGMSSILLAESVVLQRPVLSIQLNLKREEVLITNLIGATVTLKDLNSLDHILRRALEKPEYRSQLIRNQLGFKIVSNSTGRWHEAIREINHSGKVIDF